MNGFAHIRKNPEIVEHATDWIARLDRGLTAAEERRFQAWLFEADENMPVFMELAKLWDRIDILSTFAEIRPEPAKPHHPRWPSVVAMAASLLAVVAASLWVFGLYTAADDPVVTLADVAQTYQTATGERSDYVLEDGTTISLNTNTRVVVEYTPKNRFLYLEKGEIHVEVARDTLRPLSVYYDGHVVQAVGTEFNVEISDDQNIEIVVAEGIVSVGVVDRAVADKLFDEPLALPSTSTLIAAGQEAVVDRKKLADDDVMPTPIKAEEIAVKLSWRQGNLIFRGESLEEAISEVGRYTAIEFIILDEDAKKERVAGMFKAGDVDGLLKALRDNFNISYERIADDKVVLGSSRAK